MSVKRLFNDRRQFVDANGVPYNGALIFVYLAGSTTRANTYNSSTGSVANSNPLATDSAGRLQSEVWVTAGLTYKLVLAAAGDGDSVTNPSSPIWTEDNISGINDSTISQDQWVSGPTPTYVSATTFTLVGDQTSTYKIGRRVKATVTAGTVYGTILSSSFGVVTTVALTEQTASLDSGLSAISYGLIMSRGSDRSVLSGPTLATEKVSTSGTSIDFTSIPSGTKRITVMLNGVSTNGTSNIIVQIGDSGGIQTSGYLSAGTSLVAAAAVAVTVTAGGFLIHVPLNAGNVHYGKAVLDLQNASTFTWNENGIVQQITTGSVTIGAGIKALSAELDRVRVTMVNGTDTFDLGTINVSYE